MFSPVSGHASSQQEEIEETYQNDGVAEAMKRFLALAGVSFDDREPDAELPEPKPGRIANLGFFLAHDARAVRLYRPDLPTLRTHAHRIVPAAGERTETFPRHCAQALATELGRPLAEFPGGHNGSVLRPRAFAARLRDVLSGRAGDVDNGSNRLADTARSVGP